MPLIIFAIKKHMILDARSLLNLLLNFGIDAPGIYRPPNLKIFKLFEIFSLRNYSYFEIARPLKQSGITGVSSSNMPI